MSGGENRHDWSSEIPLAEAEGGEVYPRASNWGNTNSRLARVSSAKTAPRKCDLASVLPLLFLVLLFLPASLTRLGFGFARVAIARRQGLRIIVGWNQRLNGFSPVHNNMPFPPRSGELSVIPASRLIPLDRTRRLHRCHWKR